MHPIQPKCELCEALAVTVTIDTIVHGIPVSAEDRKLWSTCQAEGLPHYRCAAHPWEIQHLESEDG